jgi:hypothetical protein
MILGWSERDAATDLRSPAGDLACRPMPVMASSMAPNQASVAR